MTTPDDDDAALLARLGVIARTVDPVPELAYELGRSVFGRHRLDDELAALVADSLADAGAVRGRSAAARLLSFQAGDVTIDVQVDDGRVLGQVEGAAPASLVLETAEGATTTVLVDSDGRFTVTELPAALVRFRLVAAGVTTAWVRL